MIKHKNAVMNKVKEIFSFQKNDARYFLNQTLCTCGKESNNPAEQNHWSVVAHIGCALYPKTP